MRHFPIYLDLQGAPVLIVGGGEVAARKVALLREAGATITVVAPHLSPSLEMRVVQGMGWIPRRFESADVHGMQLVIAATDIRETNAAVSLAARAANVPVNVVDDLGLSTFIVPAIVDRSPLVVAISSGGAAPMLATRLRVRIEALLDESWGRLALFADRWRQRIREAFPSLSKRRGFYDWLLHGPVATAVRAGREGEADYLLEQCLAAGQEPNRGIVSLVGAGPGDPGLLTIRALRLLQAADVILVDRLVTPEILACVRRDAELIEIGKMPGDHGVRQDRINRLMVDHARRGRSVVRLKGGDPFVFGRGGEELEYLKRHDIAFEVVPGVTAAQGCAAYAGIPLTHRDCSQGLKFVTAHCRESLDEVDWHGLARPRQTLAIYMGIAELATIRDRLIEAGLSPATPAALVANGTRPDQRVVVSNLVSLPETAHRQSMRTPAMLYIGDVARFAMHLAWFGSHPIFDVSQSPQEISNTKTA